MRLTTKGIAKMVTPGRYPDADTPTLYLVVKPSGARSWVQRLVIRSVRCDLGLGSTAWRSLAEARGLARENRRIARQGGDPRRPKTMTFRQASERALQANRAKWRHGKSASNWITTMQQYVYPVFGDTPVDQIDGAAVLRVLAPIWSTKPEQGRKVRGRLRTVFAWCQAHALIKGANPAGESIAAALPSLKGQQRHFRALPYSDVAGALRTIEASGAALSVKAAIRFLTLTAARSGEVRLATWAEINEEAREWRIPASRMKTAVEHRVPLSDAALRVLASVRPLRGGDDLIFPSPARPGQAMSDMALTRAVRLAGLADAMTIHGQRAAFRTWAGEKTDTPFYVAEQALAHAVGGGVALSYLRSDAFAARRGLMDQWADHVT